MLLIILLYIVIVTPITNATNEPFNNIYPTNNSYLPVIQSVPIVGSIGQYCTSCGDRSRFECNSCSNCGYCVNYNSGSSQCVSGDQNGPYFRSDCDVYEYSNPWINYLQSMYIFPVAYPNYNSYPYPVYEQPRTLGSLRSVSYTRDNNKN
jgi:hypothetical protein